MNYAMNRKTGKAYAVTTGNEQTRNRVQLEGMEIRSPEHTRYAVSSLAALSQTEATICFMAEKVLRGKHKRSELDRNMVALYRTLQQEVMA